SILDNIRGHAYRPNNNLLVTVASGANANAIAEFDTGGNYLGNFIGVGVGGLNSPFAILFRENDILISQSSSPTGVKQYDLSGNYLSQWASISSFPQQMYRLADGRIAVANFSGTGSTGIRLYTADGTFLRLLSGVTGNRGVYQLPNGNFLTTNSSGLHEIDSTTGNLVRTIQVGSSFQYINLYTPRPVSVQENGAPVPSEVMLSQNYPNPFNPKTSLSISLPGEARVDLSVYDLTGRKVLTLMQTTLPAGTHRVAVDGAGLASGVYFCRLQARSTSSPEPFEAVRVRKLVLTK
ncbi:MAG TPA: T9SS type A sorting domain-containing protein, partial [Bacteroidota bacterium]|nr:T9SS type A sorting domain-containing protein [Bacteroidota bacterium]